MYSTVSRLAIFPEPPCWSTALSYPYCASFRNVAVLSLQHFAAPSFRASAFCDNSTKVRSVRSLFGVILLLALIGGCRGRRRGNGFSPFNQMGAVRKSQNRAAVSGTIRSICGPVIAPLSGAVIRLFAKDGRLLATTKSDIDGRFALHSEQLPRDGIQIHMRLEVAGTYMELPGEAWQNQFSEITVPCENIDQARATKTSTKPPSAPAPKKIDADLRLNDPLMPKAVPPGAP